MGRPAREADDYAHGTFARYYWFKCRCDVCREYQRTRVAANRAKRLAEGNINHGRRSGYDAGCRCTPCKDTRVYARLYIDTPNDERRELRKREEK